MVFSILVRLKIKELLMYLVVVDKFVFVLFCFYGIIFFEGG